MIVYKKALRCIDLSSWNWEYVILTLEVDPKEIIYWNYCDRHYGRAPKAEVISCRSLDRFVSLTATAQFAWRADYFSGALGTARLDPDCYLSSWFIRHNFTKVKDGDICAWYNHHRYVVGETVYPDKFDDDASNFYSHGINFFFYEGEAERF